MQETNPLVELLKRDKRFKMESYRFVNEALAYAQNVLKMGRAASSEPTAEVDAVEERHVTGQDLSRAVKDFAVEQFGYMARPVLSELGIKKTDDIGRIVYNLIDIGYMRKTADDRLEDFSNVFDLGEELDRSFTFRKNDPA